jgi:hypothetical protein
MARIQPDPEPRMARSPDLQIAQRVVPGRPVPEPAGAVEWRLVGEALIDQLRHEHGLPANIDTLAVGWTNVDGLEAWRFIGGSRAPRTRAALPNAAPHLQAPRVNHQFVDHAEQDVGNAFLDTVTGARARVRPYHWLRIYLTKASGPCSACTQGLDNRLVAPGVLGQLTQRFPDLTVTLAWPRPGGQLGHMILQNGERLW